VHGGTVGEASYETDRARFIGRGNSVANPQALRNDAALSGTQGSVLDPIVAIRQRITLAPKQTVTVDLVTGIGEDRAACHSLMEKYQDRRLADRAFEMAWTHSQVVLRQLNITEADAQIYGRLTSSILYANASLRAEAGRDRRQSTEPIGACGAMRSPATCPSCFCRSRVPTTSSSCVNSSRRTPIGASRGSRSIS
jgi:cellobiose phosphorylase